MSRRSAGVRGVLVAVAFAVGAGSLGSAFALRRSLERQLAEAAELGVLTPSLEGELRRAESPVRARLHLARALLASAFEEAGNGGADASPERLEAAAGLARSVLAEHPASWEAAALAGAAIYLRWSLVRDPRLLQEYPRWEQPLLHALELAPDHRYPAHYLAAAYLELWPVLSEEKRSFAKDLMESAFTDRDAFARLLDPWLQVADGEAALAPIPDRSSAWAAVRSRAGRAGDWSAYCESWRRERQALHRELEERLVEAGRLASAGELAQARKQLLAVVSTAPPDTDFAPLVEGALGLLPHGSRPAEPSEFARRWLAWAQAQELTSGPQPLSMESLVRLRVLALPRGSTDPAGDALAAWVELARGRQSRADEIEAGSEGTWQPEWAPYHLIAARHHLEKKHRDRALQAIQQVHADWRSHPVFLNIAERLGHRPPEPGARPRQVGGPLDWSYSGATARLVFETPVSAGGMGLTMAEVPAQGFALAIRWDGATLDCRPLDPGARRLEIPLEARPGVHELELEPLAGGKVYPESAELLPPSPPGRSG